MIQYSEVPLVVKIEKLSGTLSYLCHQLVRPDFLSRELEVFRAEFCHQSVVVVQLLLDLGQLHRLGRQSGLGSGKVGLNSLNLVSLSTQAPD